MHTLTALEVDILQALANAGTTGLDRDALCERGGNARVLGALSKEDAGYGEQGGGLLALGYIEGKVLPDRTFWYWITNTGLQALAAQHATNE